MDNTVKEMQPADLLAKIERGEDIQIIDVREPDEWNAGHIPQAKHIPLGDIPHSLEQLDKQKPLVMVCRSGARSHHACEFLKHHGFEAENMVGGMLAWPGDVERV